MEKMFVFKMAGKNFHLPKLIGAFIAFFGLLMFFYSVAVIFESYDNVRVVKGCIENAAGESTVLAECNEIAQDSLGVYIKVSQTTLNLKQISMALIPPVAYFFWWISVMIFGFVLYKSGRLSLPVVSETVAMKRRWGTKKKKK